MSHLTPFFLISKMEDTVALIDTCLQQMELCCNLNTKLKKLKESEQKKDSTRIMLILTRYGSKTRFMSTIAEVVTEFGGKLNSLETHVKEMEKMLKTKSSPCPKCNGRGILSKWEYVRERGTVQPILRSKPCDKCGGKGELIIPQAVEPFISLFVEIVNKFVLSQRQCQHNLDVFNVVM